MHRIPNPRLKDSRASVFSWTAVPESLYYEVRIVSDAGDLLWRERVEGTEWRLPGDLALTPALRLYSHRIQDPGPVTDPGCRRQGIHIVLNRHVHRFGNGRQVGHTAPLEQLQRMSSHGLCLANADIQPKSRSTFNYCLPPCVGIDFQNKFSMFQWDQPGLTPRIKPESLVPVKSNRLTSTNPAVSSMPAS